MTKAKPPLPPDDLDQVVIEHDVEIDGAESNAEQKEVVESPAPAVPPAPPAQTVPAPPPIAARAPMPAYGNPLEKSPGLALFLSIFFPGLGHIYVGSYERALMIISGIGICVTAMVFSDGRLWPLGFVIAFSYFFAIFDAYREAQIANLAADQELPKPRRQGEGRLIFGVFLSVLAILVLADNLGLFNITWIYDWWPVLVLIVGFYFIGSWIWEKMNSSRSSEETDFD